MNINALMKRMNEERKAEATNLRLGHLIGLLEKRPRDQSVYFDFCQFGVEGIGSYRGFYEDLALQPGLNNQKFAKVGPLVDRLKQAVGEVFTGYKGGDFTMGEETLLWAAGYGESGSTAIVGVTGDDCITIIETKWVEI